MPEEAARSNLPPDTTQGVEAKWKANQEKVAFMKRFPGLAGSWHEVEGKSLEHVVPLPSKPAAAVLLFSDGTFLVAAPVAPEPWELGEALTALRPHLEARYREAYVEYDRLVRKDREALRQARLEKIIGAIRNNVEQIPELKDRLRRLLEEWREPGS